MSKWIEIDDESEWDNGYQHPESTFTPPRAPTEHGDPFMPDQGFVKWGQVRLSFNDQEKELSPERAPEQDNLVDLFETEPSPWPWIAAGAGVLAVFLIWRMR